MRRIATTTLLGFLVAIVFAAPLYAQQEGDFRTRDSGDWSNPQIWERFNGSAWAAFGTPPSGSEGISVGAEDSVFVDVATTVTGHLANEGIVETDGMLTIGDGGVYEHARDGGKLPQATWAEGSTLLMTGTESTAPDDRNQNYHHITFNTPNQLSNLNMALDSVTVSGDIRIIDTGVARWYLTSATANESAWVTIMGDVIMEAGNFSVQGTGNANTTFVVDHYGDIEVTGGNFSISRGSQGGGTTTWYLHEGDFSMSNATTQSSTATPGGARFVFTSGDRQTLTLGEGNTLSALPIEVAEGTTLDVGTSTLDGSGIFDLRGGATLATAHPGGVAALFAPTQVGAVTLEDDASFEFNGTEAQVTSDRMPAAVQNLTIDNAAGVTLSQETTVNGVLALRAGVFDNTIPFVLGAEGSVSLEGGSLAVPVSSEAAGEVPAAFAVHQNYPNPFNPTTRIRYELPAAAEVTVRVFNMLGQEVLSVFEGQKPAGVHAVLLDASALGSGMYVYRVESAEHAVSKRMILIK